MTQSNPDDPKTPRNADLSPLGSLHSDRAEIRRLRGQLQAAGEALTKLANPTHKPKSEEAALLQIEVEEIARAALGSSTKEPQGTKVYAVEWGNEFPAEINSLWVDREAAEQRAELLNTRAIKGADNWGVREWFVGVGGSSTKEPG